MEAILFEAPYQKGNLSINIEPHFESIKDDEFIITIFDISKPHRIITQIHVKVPIVTRMHFTEKVESDMKPKLYRTTLNYHNKSPNKFITKNGPQ